MGKPISQIPVDKLHVGLKFFDNDLNLECKIILLSKDKFSGDDVIVYQYDDGGVTCTWYKFSDLRFTFVE